MSLMPLDPTDVDLLSMDDLPDTSSATSDGELVMELDPRAAEMLEEYRVAKDAAKRWEASEKQLRGELLHLLGPAIGATLDGSPVLRRSTVESWRVDTHALKKRYPDVWRACQHMTTSQRLTVIS